MNWEQFWNRRGAFDDAARQVGRLHGKQTLSTDISAKCVEHLIQIGEINSAHHILDICCGNGMITALIAQHCNKIVGIDFAESLLIHARNSYPHIDFYQDDVKIPFTKLPTSMKFDRITCCFSFQYFETYNHGLAVIKNLLPYLHPKGKIILTDVPDRKRFFRYYNSYSRLFHLAMLMANNKNDMGKFWSEEELNLIANELGLTGKKIEQPKDLPYAAYRMDYVFSNQ
jgi:ubiquinone/menaquinone biosynthesis C-methylase UbiE